MLTTTKNTFFIKVTHPLNEYFFLKLLPHSQFLLIWGLNLNVLLPGIYINYLSSLSAV